MLTVVPEGNEPAGTVTVEVVVPVVNVTDELVEEDALVLTGVPKVPLGSFEGAGAGTESPAVEVAPTDDDCGHTW